MWGVTTIEVTAFFQQLDEAAFAAEREGRWSFAQNLDHLVRSVTPVARALRLPKMALRFLFGKADASATYQEIHDRYKAELRAGAEAPKAFVTTRLESQSVLLNRWASAARSLDTALDKWNEEQLDRLRLPHPILGKISVREMLYFTDLHARHHLDNCRKS